MKKLRKTREQETLSLSPDMKVSDVIDQWPQTLITFVKMGFGPLQNAFLRKTLARNVTIQQAADFRNVDLNILLINLQNAIANPTHHDEHFVDPCNLRYDENAIPDLQGDITMAGLIPCPVHNILMERIDSFVQRAFTSRGRKFAWWLAAEGAGSGDIKNHIKSIVKSRQYATFPDVFLAVGTELFLHEDFCRDLYQESVFKRLPGRRKKRKELNKLEDPNEKLQLQFAVLFSFYCTPETLEDIPLPKTWFDLTDPVYKNKIVIPSLNLPVIPDLLAALYHHLGDALFMKFSQNVAYALHPAQSSSRKTKRNAPGIFITPVHFSKIIKAPGHRHILPEDGCVAVPAYIVQTMAHNADADRIIDFLLSEELLRMYYDNGTFIPNHNGIRVDYPLETIITRPWSSLLEIIPDIFLQQLLRNFKLGVSS